MRTKDQRKGQLRDLGRSGSHVRLIALLLEQRMSPIDEFEKTFAEAYLMKLANLCIPTETGLVSRQKAEEEIDPFA